MDKSFSLETDRLLVRILKTRDRDAFFIYRTLPEIYQYQAWKPSSISVIDSFILKNTSICPNTPNTWLQLAVCLKDGKLIGDIGLHFMEDTSQVEIGSTLSPEFQGKGYAYEAAYAVISYLFTSLSKHRVIASVDPNNLKSIKLLTKLGFRKEAHFIKSFNMDGKWYDEYVFAVLESEW
ncbi:MAG: GNAT family N-acetyltransferase [Oscillospiraceae bacterium]|nr:GNAT family N-acetyltransferase [Oscillospiraceae bacterium]